MSLNWVTKVYNPCKRFLERKRVENDFAFSFVKLDAHASQLTDFDRFTRDNGGLAGTDFCIWVSAPNSRDTTSGTDVLSSTGRRWLSTRVAAAAAAADSTRAESATHSLARKDFRRSRNRRFTFAIVERTLDRSERAQLIQLAVLKNLTSRNFLCADNGQFSTVNLRRFVTRWLGPVTRVSAFWIAHS